MWPRKDGSSVVSLSLGVGRAGLGELAGDPSDLHDRDPAGVGEHDRHLEDDFEPVADRVGRALERLGAVAGLEEKGFAAADAGQLLGEVASLAGEHERGLVAELLSVCSSAPSRATSVDAARRGRQLWDSRS